MKKRIFIVFIMAFLLILTSCSKKKVEEKIAEKIIESATGGKVNIDSKQDNTTIKTDDGITQFGSNLKWPKENMDAIPELKANITWLFEDKQSKTFSIAFDSLKQEDAKKYLEKLRELGYRGGWESESSDGFTFSGYKEDNTEIAFLYGGEGGGTLSYIKDSSAAKSNFESEQPEEIDMTDAVPWPKDFLNDVPELEGKITGISTSGNSKYISLEYVEKEDLNDFLEKLKTEGYNVDSSESVTGDTISYYSYNDKGDYIGISWVAEGYTSIDLQKAE